MVIVIRFEDMSIVVRMARGDMNKFLRIMEYSHNADIKLYYAHRLGDPGNQDGITVGIGERLFVHFTMDGKFHSSHKSSGNWPTDEKYHKEVVEGEGDFEQFMIKFLAYYVEDVKMQIDIKNRWAMESLLEQGKSAPPNGWEAAETSVEP